MEIDYKTKCRCLFVLTLSIYNNANILVDDSFFNLLHSFARDSIFENKKNIDKFYKILYFKKTGKYSYGAYETEKTISDLFKELSTIKTMFDLQKLYREIDQKDIDIISDLAMDFINYNEMFYSETIQHFKE